MIQCIACTFLFSKVNSCSTKSNCCSKRKERPNGRSSKSYSLLHDYCYGSIWISCCFYCPLVNSPTRIISHIRNRDFPCDISNKICRPISRLSRTSRYYYSTSDRCSPLRIIYEREFNISPFRNNAIAT